MAGNGNVIFSSRNDGVVAGNRHLPHLVRPLESLSWSLQEPLPNYYIDRPVLLKKVLDKLEEPVRVPGQLPIFILYGMCGAGKKTLAIRIAHIYQKEKKYFVAYFKNLENLDTLVDKYNLIAALAGMDKHPEKELIIKSVKHYFEQQNNWLLILENCSKVVFDEISPSLPGGNGKILVTSKTQWSEYHDRSVFIDMMAIEEAKNLFDFLTKNSFVDQDYKAILKDRLGLLPLAITQAGSYLSQPFMSLEEYQSLFDDKNSRLELLKRKIPFGGGVGHLPVYETFEALFTLIGKDPIGQAVIQLIQLLGYSSCQINVDKHKNEIFTLITYQLVAVESKNVNIHNLVKALIPLILSAPSYINGMVELNHNGHMPLKNSTLVANKEDFEKKEKIMKIMYQNIFYFLDTKTLLRSIPLVKKDWSVAINDLTYLENRLANSIQEQDKAMLIYKIIRIKYKLFELRTQKQIKDTGIQEMLIDHFIVLQAKLQKIDDFYPHFHQPAFDREGLGEHLENLLSITWGDLDRIKTRGSSHTDRASAVSMLSNLEYYYKRFMLSLNLVDDISAPARIPVWNESRLWLEQEDWHLDEQAKTTWTAFLKQVRQQARRHWSVPNKCFITYAWPSEKNKEMEKWIQPFLERLRDDLIAAGIQAKLDIKDNTTGRSIYNYMDELKDADCTLIIGTASLLEKHSHATSAVCSELILANRKRRKGEKVFPVLLSGSFEEAFPPYFELYTTVKNWQSKTYVNNMQALIRDMFAVGPDDAQYKKLWSEFVNDPVHIGLAQKGLSKAEVEDRLASKKLDDERSSKANELEAAQRQQRMHEKQESILKSREQLLISKVLPEQFDVNIASGANQVNMEQQKVNKQFNTAPGMIVLATSTAAGAYSNATGNRFLMEFNEGEIRPNSSSIPLAFSDRPKNAISITRVEAISTAKDANSKATGEEYVVRKFQPNVKDQSSGPTYENTVKELNLCGLEVAAKGKGAVAKGVNVNSSTTPYANSSISGSYKFPKNQSKPELN